MKIDRLELLHLKLPLVHFFETSFGRVYDHEVLIVRAESGGIVGFGEVPASAAPRYSYETVQTAWHILRDFLAPRLKGQEILAPGPISELFSFVRGHNMAKAGIEMAILDLFGKAQGKPIWQILGGERTEIPTGVSLGIEDTVPDLIKRVEQALSKGYQRIKLKIKPRWDVDVVAEVRRKFPTVPLSVDANSAYSLSDIDHLKKLDAFDLMMIEQPLSYDDYVDHAKLQAQIKTPVCLDESIRSYDDARRAFELGACRVINIKQARVGGPYSAKMIHNVARAHKAPVWCGGLLETGIGRAHNIALATLPNFTLPGDISASERYYAEDVIDPPVTVTPQGTILVFKGPGIGYNVLEKRLARYCVRREYVLSKCNTDLPEGSAFCNKCGASLQPGAAPAHPSLPPGVHPASVEPEQELWKGCFSAKAQGHWWFLWFLEIPVLIFVWFKLSEQLRQGPIAKWVFVAAAVVPVLLLLWTWLIERLSTRYRLTTHRLFKETGILSRQLNEIELVRVDDVAVRQNVIQRIFNVGIVTVIAPHDQTEPRLELTGIENPIEVKEMIRNNVRRRRQGSLNVENL